MGFSVVSEITPAVIPSVFITHVKMGRMESSAPPVAIIFLNLISQSVHGIFRCLFS